MWPVPWRTAEGPNSGVSSGFKILGAFWYESTGKNVGLFITGHSEVYKEWVKVGERGLKSNSSDAEIGYIWEAPGLNHNNGWLKKQPEISASVRNSAHGKGHEEGGLAYAKAWSSLRKPRSRASTPKTRVYLLYCFMLSTIPLTLRGALPHHHFSQRRS